MAYTPGNLTQISSVNGFSIYRYDDLDANSLVDIAGYFNNSDDTLNMAPGDIVLAVDWATAVRSGTISGWGIHMVMTVSAAGVVDLAEALAGNVTNSD
jgi:hypothetical protein